MHLCFPVEFLNLPSAHSLQSPPSGPVKPAWHLHWVTLALPSSDIEFEGHAAHALPLANENVLTGQFTHMPDEFAPATDECLPVAHDMHTPAPAPSLNLPAEHA